MIDCGQTIKAGAASRLEGLGGAGVGQLAMADEAKSPPSLTSLGRAYHSRLHAYKQAASHQPADTVVFVPPSSPLLCALRAWLPTASRVRAIYMHGIVLQLQCLDLPTASHAERT